MAATARHNIMIRLTNYIPHLGKHGIFVLAGLLGVASSCKARYEVGQSLEGPLRVTCNLRKRRAVGELDIADVIADCDFQRILCAGAILNVMD